MLPMSVNKSLAQGETVVLELRTHPKALFVPDLVLVLLVAATAAVLRFGPENPVIRWGTVGVAAGAALVWVVVPFLRWFTTSYTITTKRLSTRTGVLTRTGRDIPLYRINDVTYEKGPVDRLFGCGTLIISDATAKPGMRLRDVPSVEEVQVRLHELLFAADDGSDDGEWPPSEPQRA